ncbi:Cationic amino acid transporter 1 [Glycine soja]|uniref:Cationic amino acid transporter 1 n=1 Tax=Glycine soja TaxID=3848 RepID=A0A0B2RPJ5_GLYSO|nr:Cationic amino acid transporter 1 [Glycine soja]
MEGNDAEGVIKLESFQSAWNYGKALLETPCRLVDRVTGRSMDEVELKEVKKRSEHEMKKTLTWWDLIWFGMGSVIGSGIFVLTGFEVKNHVGPGVVLSYVISGISAMLSVFCYTEFAVEIPVAGNVFPFLAFPNLTNIHSFRQHSSRIRDWWCSSGTLMDILLRHSLQPTLRQVPHPSPRPVVIGFFAVFSTKGSSRFNYIASIVHVIVLIFIIVAGLTKAEAKNYSDFLPFGPRGIFQASAVLFFAYVGFDAVSTMAEETKNPGRDIPIGLIGSMACTTFLYCMLSVTLCLMQKFSDVDENAAFSVAFEAVGMSWAKYIVAFGALKGMTSVLLVGAVGQARYLTHIARTHLLPPWLAKVNERTGTPIYATVVMLSATAIVAFFTSLDILANLLSISTLFLFSLVALALLVRRYCARGVATQLNVVKFIVCIILIVGSSVASAVYWANTTKWVGYTIMVPLWFVGTVGIWLLVPLTKKPKIWGVPLVPFLPSASIGINIFLLGSLDKASFRRFGVWTAILLVYYLFVGLHASYDMAKIQKKQRLEAKTESKLDEENVAPSVTGSGTNNEDHI